MPSDMLMSTAIWPLELLYSLQIVDFPLLVMGVEQILANGYRKFLWSLMIQHRDYISAKDNFCEIAGPGHPNTAPVSYKNAVSPLSSWENYRMRKQVTYCGIFTFKVQLLFMPQS